MDTIKQKKSEALGLYHLYWDSYTKGNLEAFSATLDDTFQKIGTSESEVCCNKEEGIEFYKAQMNEVVGKAEMRNRIITAIPVDELFLINELCDIYILTETDWSFYSKIRISTFLHETSSGWKVVQQHGLLPDMRVQEGESLTINKISKENLELRDAVKRHTADLENKTRELEIEAALERVRAASMAMHYSDELSDMLSVLFDQFDILGISPSFTHLTLFDEINKAFSFRMSGRAGHRVLVEQIHEINRLEAWKTAYEHWKSADPNIINCIDYPPEALPMIFDIIEPITSAMPEESRIRIEDFPNGLYTVQGHCKFGYLGFHHNRRATEEEKNIVTRFAGEFGRVYQRFLDLKKSEAQTREAQVETSLERVRAKAMAMHSSKGIVSAVAVVFNELSRLGINIERCGITLMNETPVAELWSTPLSKDNKEVVDIVTGYLDFRMHPILEKSYKDWQDKKDFSTYKLVGEEVKKYYAKLEKQPEYKFPKVANYPDQQILQTFYFKEGAIFAFTVDELSAEAKDIIQKLTKVFAQTYTRFLDLQKAEEQAREAKVEAALERIRSRSMAMQSSDELSEVVRVMYDEIEKLEISNWGCALMIFDDRNKNIQMWFSEHVNNQHARPYDFDNLNHELVRKWWKFWKSEDEFLSVHLKDEECIVWTNYLFQDTGMKKLPKEVKEAIMSESEVYFEYANMKHGLVSFINLEPFCKDIIPILKRVARTFEQAYTRFLDVQIAEESARKAEIEASLERVRGMAMGMGRSKDLNLIAETIFKELEQLDIKLLRFGIGILDGETVTAELWTSTVSEGTPMQITGSIPLNWHPMLMGGFSAWREQAPPFIYKLEGKELHDYYKGISKTNYNIPGKQLDTDVKIEGPQYWVFISFSAGGLYAFTLTPPTSREISILKRYSDVFQLAYTRFEDLQKAEARTRAAIREASLDRVRAQIAAMRSPDDLQQITPLIWSELTAHGIPFIRCGVFIMDDERERVHTYLSSPDGKAIAALHLPYRGISLAEQVLIHWQDQTVYTEHWNKEDFRAWTQQLIDEGYIQSKENYRAGSEPENLHLHFVPFLQGMLYVGNTEPLPTESLTLIQSLADAFSTAYARYEDFNKLEAAKEKVEQTLTDLHAAKDQLVQQEKLASLGQLTAGIAHEIKNPLNFVNNFSEVSIELLQELWDEVENVRAYRDTPLPDDALNEITNLADDIESNLKTIYKHGSSADSIVKSMLQHSRGGDGKMEPTPLNPLIKEYVNLAFHGMRAGKEPINVDIDLQLNNSIGEVPLVAEDFSRVILNLCNNAFDAMREKANGKRETTQKYMPKLTVRTLQKGNVVIIEIKDNGPGIPDEIKDKILQPFFTTKKGTQGTGLGLSITNDIVKAHGGNLDIQTDQDGSIFSVTLNT